MLAASRQTTDSKGVNRVACQRKFPLPSVDFVKKLIENPLSSYAISE